MPHPFTEEQVREELAIQRHVAEVLHVHAVHTQNLLDDPSATIPDGVRAMLREEAQILAKAHQIFVRRADAAEAVYMGKEPPALEFEVVGQAEALPPS